MPLRVAFFGTPSFAVPTLEHLVNSRHQLTGVITQPDRPRGRGQQITHGPVKSLAVSLNLPVLQPAKKSPDATRPANKRDCRRLGAASFFMVLFKQKDDDWWMQTTTGERRCSHTLSSDA